MTDDKKAAEELIETLEDVSAASRWGTPTAMTSTRAGSAEVETVT